MTTPYRNSDFYTDFVIHPIKGDLALRTEVAAIMTSIKNIVFTNRYERPFAPMRGAGIPATLFENMTTDTEYMLETRIKEAIDADEPRATNVQVNVVTAIDRNEYTATILFTPVNTTERVTVSAIFKRVR